MNEVNIARSPLLIVLDETAVEVAARQVICRVFIEA
jgi:hypothetical protein